MVECQVVERRALAVRPRGMYDGMHSERRVLRPLSKAGGHREGPADARHESPKTTKLYDRTSDAVTLRRGLERIAI